MSERSAEPVTELGAPLLGAAERSATETSALEITGELVATLVERGGYVHPLFAAGTSGALDAAGAPLPGQAVLLLMGGLAEQSGVLDDAIALVEIARVRFQRMLRAGSSLRVIIQPLDSRVTSTAKIIQNYRWTGIDRDGEIVAEADIVMLMSSPEGK